MYLVNECNILWGRYVIKEVLENVSKLTELIQFRKFMYSITYIRCKSITLWFFLKYFYSTGNALPYFYMKFGGIMISKQKQNQFKFKLAK